MARTDDLMDIALAIIVLRSLVDWNQADLSRESGVDKGLISEYEQGKRRPSRKNRGRMAESVGADLEFFDHLVAVCRGIRQSFEKVRRQGRTGAPGRAEAAPGLEERIVEAVREGTAPFLFQLSRAGRGPRVEDQAWAAERWARMGRLAAEDQGVFVGVLEGDDRSWALAEKLAAEAAAAEQPDEAERLARLAVRLAKQSPV
jgi:transcriptional regulator with XRE-family HTH domain